MTLSRVKEYAAAIRERYQMATKEEKGKILDEFVQVTGYHRKAAIRLLGRTPRLAGSHRGRPACYQGVREPLQIIWEASDRLCSKRLQPFLPEMIKTLKLNGELSINAATEAQLTKISPATIDRLLQPSRQTGGRKPITTTRSGSLLKSLIPIRTFADWQENKPGFVETDLVAHCGESTEGFYLNTLCAVDVATGWTECRPVWGKGQIRVQQAIHGVRQYLPVPLLGIDSDNGGEFINQCLYSYCRQNNITFTRSRSYKKNDSCHVEQKNGQVIRRLVGYDRYHSKAAYECLGRLYRLVSLYTNFFQPIMKLVSKTRHGARVHKVYDTAQTPYQRMIKAGGLFETKQAELAATYHRMNPVRLLKQINDNLAQLWKLADHIRPSVTPIMRQHASLR